MSYVNVNRNITIYDPQSTAKSLLFIRNVPIFLNSKYQKSISWCHCESKSNVLSEI